MTEGKLRNFPEIEIFVTLSCPFSTNIEDDDYKGLKIINALELY